LGKVRLVVEEAIERRVHSISPDVSETGHCVAQARPLLSELKGERRMTRVLRERPFRYAVLMGVRWRGPVSAVHEPSRTGVPDRASLTAPAGFSNHALPPRRSRERSTARVRLRLKPGQKGTKRLLAQYGDRLICVRYRYDAQRKKRIKAVELLVAEQDWEPRRPPIVPDHIVGLRVDFAEVAVRDRVKQVGGTWNPERRLWQLRYDRVLALGLNRRIVNESASASRYQR
jgi:hypothetical protein